ncbi:2-oxo-4-hydroxy-4-carboxy-5-ureidoimidazoline decarboxylase [Actinokineospora auranticolor]|uniref:2-oxo-4-hydroxy-4-carboxy-5-ureidoimidazoline decarboxylase n=1 Tax=Actinokineospora auranticolor TaxID=155976 RepID=UPI001CA51175|nr:2-oxo-4-hydroxy-4-carboxy-5-ureidoimidazoline decarboxylase [Actinokineospora auranticolor]
MPSLLTLLNGAARQDAVADLLSCCASLRWADEVAAQRPFTSLGEVEEVSTAVLATLEWAEVLLAVASHPRLGDGVRGHSREAGWSREEQRSAVAAGARVRADLARGNAIYEQRFGHLFLICASGLSGEAVLSALRRRLGNDRTTERATVRAELARIVALRLRRLAVR